MDAIQKACELYVQNFKPDNQFSSNKTDNRTQEEDIHRYISIAVKSVKSASHLFQNSCIFDSLISALRVCVVNQDGITQLARAYRCLEKYFYLLVQQPWKPEFRTLKTYGGFYKTNIKSVLAKAEVIFMTAGYIVDQNNTMVYRKGEVDRACLLILSFDCYVAYLLCERIAERHNQFKTVGKTLDDAIHDILRESWPKSNAKEKSLIIDNKSLAQTFEAPAIPKREPVMNGTTGVRKSPHKTVLYPREPSPVYDVNIRSQDPEQSLGNFKYKSTDIPFIDETEHYPKLSQATPEEHMRESLKLVNEQSEWKYVQDALPKSSHPASSTTYPPGIHLPTRRRQWDYFNKEEGGIMSDINVLPTKPAFKSPAAPSSYIMFNKSVYSDQGYSTGPAYASGQDLISDTIYRPPAINAEMNIVSPVPAGMEHVMLPPKIPSRSLKPNYKPMAEEDVVDGRMMMVMDRDKSGAAKQPTKVAIPPSSSSSHGVSLPIRDLNVSGGQALRPPRSLHQIKSSSLKAAPKKLVIDSRVVKSMDYSHDRWQCPMCDGINSSLTDNCLQCSFLRPRGSAVDNQSPVQPKNSCLSCTFENDLTSTVCEMCQTVLPP